MRIVVCVKQVAVLGEGNKVEFKTVQLGRDFGDSVEITAGLAAQDRVIDSPPEALQSGDVVQLAAAAPSPPSTQAGASTPSSPPSAQAGAAAPGTGN